MTEKIISFIDLSSIAEVSSLHKEIVKAPDGYLCLGDPAVLANLNKELIIQRMHRIDILHCGLCYHQGEPLANLQLVSFNWNFLNPRASLVSTSWKVSLEFIVFDKALYNAMMGIDVKYKSLLGALLEFSYRVLREGGVPCHDPSFYEPGCSKPVSRLPSSDESRFVLHHFGRRIFFYYRLCVWLLERKWLPIEKKSYLGNSTGRSRVDYPFKLINQFKKAGIDKYTAIIPTINRYDYVSNAIDSLLQNPFPPSEIIVVDQSPKENRIPGYYDVYEKSSSFKVIFLETAGQSLARNEGINNASYDWLYLFDDDSLCWSNTILEHWHAIESSGSMVSTGASVAPEKSIDEMPGNTRPIFISDVLDTGNCFIHRSVVQEVGMLDAAFNHGSGADDDLGKRIYLHGHKIVFNPKAIRTHFKAATGGLREYGAWWRFKATVLGAFPPATQYYAINKFYRRNLRPFLILSLILKAKRNYSWPSYLLLLVLLPYKILRSRRGVKRLNLERA